MAEAAVSDLKLSVMSTYPGYQFYTGNALEATGGPCGASYGRHVGLCIEPMYPPDDVNRERLSLTKAGVRYREEIVYEFSF